MAASRKPALPCAVYGLAVEGEAGALRYFFIGGLDRSSGNLWQHVAIQRAMQPGLAAHLKLLEANGLRYGAVILCECASDAAREGLPGEPRLADQIRFQVIRLLREGRHMLLNERTGTPRERDALAADVDSGAIQSARDLAQRRALLAQRAQIRAHRASDLKYLACAWQHNGPDAAFRVLQRVLPALGRRLSRLSVIALPPPGTSAAAAFAMMIAAARRAEPAVADRMLREIQEPRAIRAHVPPAPPPKRRGRPPVGERV